MFAYLIKMRKRKFTYTKFLLIKQMNQNVVVRSNTSVYFIETSSKIKKSQNMRWLMQEMFS